MAEFRDHILGMLQPADLISTGFQISRPADPLEGLFDDLQTNNLVATYHTLASQYQIPQMAQFHAFDVPAQKSIPAPIDEHNVEKGLIKVKRSTSELLRQLLGRGVTVEAELYNYVTDFASELSDQVVTRAKVARAEVMATGKMTIKENDLDVTVDYGVPAANLALELDFGAGADESIPDQIQAIVDGAAEVGVTLTGIVTSRSVLTKLRQNADVQKLINGINMAGVLVSNNALRAWLDDEYGITRVITDDLSYSTPYTMGSDGRPVVASKRYFPKNVVSFFGTSNGMKLGSSLWGVPPEEEISQFYTAAGASTVSPYVYMTQWAETDPAILWTKASALYIPVLYNPNSLYVAKVIETPSS